MTRKTIFMGIPLESLPEGWSPTDVVALIKCTDEDGDDAWAFRTSDGLSDEEALGAMVIRVELTKSWAVDAWKAID